MATTDTRAALEQMILVRSFDLFPDRVWPGAEAAVDLMAAEILRLRAEHPRAISAPVEEIESDYPPLGENEVVSQGDDAAFRLAIQECDRKYHADGAAGTKTWFRDYFVPELGRSGFKISRGFPPAVAGSENLRDALTRLYLEAHRAGVEAAGDAVGGSPRNTIWAARDRLADTARQYLADEDAWTDPDSPLAQALALSAPEERGEEERVRDLEEAAYAVYADACRTGQTFPALTHLSAALLEYHREDLEAMDAPASPPAPVGGQNWNPLTGPLHPDTDAEIGFAHRTAAPTPAVAQGEEPQCKHGVRRGEDCGLCDLGNGFETDADRIAPAVAQGAEEPYDQIMNDLRRAVEFGDRLADPYAVHRAFEEAQRRVSALARPVAGSEERERVARELWEMHQDEGEENETLMYRRAWETLPTEQREAWCKDANRILAALRGQEAEGE